MSKRQTNSLNAQRERGKATKQTEQVELVRVSLDEFNLATFPVSVLDKKAQRSREPLHFRDVITVAGRQVERHWKVFPHQEEGFPGPADDDVLMALFEITREQGGAKKIFFTRYQLCKKLGWPLNTFYYKRIESSFRKLAAVHVEATNAFGDQERKKFINMGFTIIQEYKLFDESAGHERLSYVLWSDRIAASISQKLTKDLDASFYFEELETPLEKRLFRYLDNHFDQIPEAENLVINIYDLCYEHLGIARRYRYASQLMQKVEGPLQKLVDKQFLRRWWMEEDNLLVARTGEFASRVKLSIPYAEMLEDLGISPVTEGSPEKSEIEKQAKGVRRKKPTETPLFEVTQPLTGLAGELAARGVDVSVACDIASKSINFETQVMAAIKYFDTECARGKRFENPAGLLVSLVRKSLANNSQQAILLGLATENTTDKNANWVVEEETTKKHVEDEVTLQAWAEMEYQQYLVDLGREQFEKLNILEQNQLLEVMRVEMQTGTQAGKYRRMSGEKAQEQLRGLVESQLSRRQAIPFDKWYEEWRARN
jgi:Replication initiator protein A